MIKVVFAKEKPIEDQDFWSYPFEELYHIFEVADDGDVYLYYDGRLYEAPYLDIDNLDYIAIKQYGQVIKDEEYVPSAENGDYSPGNPWDAPGMSIHDFI